MNRRMIFILLTVLLMWGLCACEMQRVDGNAAGTIAYAYGGVTFEETLSAAEVAEVAAILDGKILFADHPACIFYDAITFTIDGETFALACDGCGLVKNCETGLYMTLSDAQRDALVAMFASRGASFPSA